MKLKIEIAGQKKHKECLPDLENSLAVANDKI